MPHDACCTCNSLLCAWQNFCKNSFNLQRNEALVEQMWVEFEPLVRKTPPAAEPTPPEPTPATTTTKHDDSHNATNKRSRSSEESDAKAAKKAKKAAKVQALAVLQGLTREQLEVLVAGIDAGIDLADELQNAIASSAKEADAGQDAESMQPKKAKDKKEKKKKEKKKKKDK